MGLPEILINCFGIGVFLWIATGVLVKGGFIKPTGRPRIDAVLLKAESHVWKGWQDTGRWVVLAWLIMFMCAALAAVGVLVGGNGSGISSRRPSDLNRCSWFRPRPHRDPNRTVATRSDFRSSILRLAHLNSRTAPPPSIQATGIRRVPA